MMIMPFLGDQAFWGDMCRHAGVGPAPVAIKNVSHQQPLTSLKMLMQPEAHVILMVP